MPPLYPEKPAAPAPAAAAPAAAKPAEAPPPTAPAAAPDSKAAPVGGKADEKAPGAPEAAKGGNALDAKPAEAVKPDTVTPAEAKPEGKADGGKPGEGAKPPDKPAPAPIMLKIPEGSPLTPADVEGVKEFAKAHSLTSDQAQALLERQNAVLVDHFKREEQGGEAFTKRVEEYKSAALADKEIGGSPEKLAESAELSRRTAEKYFPKQILDFLDVTGFGSHPDFIRGFAKVGKAMADDKAVDGGTPPEKPKSIGDRMYGGKKEAAAS